MARQIYLQHLVHRWNNPVDYRLAPRAYEVYDSSEQRQVVQTTNKEVLSNAEDQSTLHPEITTTWAFHRANERRTLPCPSPMRPKQENPTTPTTCPFPQHLPQAITPFPSLFHKKPD